MGKNKQAQRTKNNARPSNSSRSAELLGNSIPKFVGFSAVKDGGYVPVLPGLSLCNTNEIEMSSVDNNFQIVLKKMNKKDTTTKCKALQEFADMCKDEELSAVEGMLPFWPRLYCALAIDIEHRVREAAQLAHTAVVKRVGKGIAMYLKQLAGAWFTSQYDTYPPAASAATYSFNSTFPEKKIVDAIVHCQREILMYICDNVTVHTPQTLSVQKNLTTEEMEAKYQRVLIASLHGYSVYLRKVPSHEVEKTIDIHQKIASSNKFWKLLKHDALPVKTAFFGVLTSIIENASAVQQSEKKRIVTTIMNSIDETEPALLAAVWESVLITINKIEDWYTVVSVEKLVLPKMWRVLRNGGYCCAGTIYPNFLPFISQFPKLNVDPLYLYPTFFNNMRQGFDVKSVKISRSETFAVATSFIECLRYSILLNVNNQDFSVALLKEQLIPVLETCLKAGGHIKQILFCEITHLLRYWSKNRHNENYKSYSTLIQAFWQSLDTLYTALIVACENSETFDTLDTNNSQIEFLSTLKTFPVHLRKKLKVQFSNSEENLTKEPEIRNIEVEIDTDPEFLIELNEFVRSLCLKYFNQMIEQRETKYAVYLNKLIVSFEGDKLSISLSELLQKQINLVKLFNEILRDCLLEESKQTEDIIQLIFNLIPYIDDSEKNEILKSLVQFNDIVTARSVIQCALSKKHRDDVILKKWCSEDKITTLLISIAKEMASDNYSEIDKNQDLILLAFEPLDDGSLLIKESGINEIVSILCNSFHHITETRQLSFAKLISHIMPLTWTFNETIPAAVQILETLFELRSQNCFYDNADFIDTLCNVWKQGLLRALQKFSSSEFVVLTKKFAASTWKKIYGFRDEENSDETLVDTAVDFLDIILSNKDPVSEDFTKEIILAFLTDSDKLIWTAEATGIALYGEVITGKLYVSSFEQKIQINGEHVSVDLIDNAVEDNVEKCLRWLLFNVKLLKNLCLKFTDKEKRDENCTETLFLCNGNIPGITHLLINIIYSTVLGQMYSTHYKFTKSYNNVSKILELVQVNFKQLRSHFNEDTINEVSDYMITNAGNYGSMLPYIIQFCCTQLYPQRDPKESFIRFKSSDIFNANTEVTQQCFQILSSFQDWSNVTELLSDDTYELIIARCMLINDEDSSKYSNILQKIISYEAENPSLLALDCNVSQMLWENLNLSLELIRLLTELIRKIPSRLTYEHWNFTLISLALWLLSIIQSKQNITDFKVTAFTVAVSQLYYTLQTLINRHQHEKISEIPPTFLNEWENVFASDIQAGIIQSWIYYAEMYNDKSTTLKPTIPLDYLGKAVKILNGNLLFKTPTNVPLATSVKQSLKLLQSSVPSIQLGAYHILKHTVAELVEQDKTIVEAENPDLSCLNIKKMEDVLQQTQNIVNAILIDFKLCDTVSCTIQPYTDSYTYTLGYLLSWAIILDMCANAHGDLLYQYAEILKDSFFPSLLNNIFRLMPAEVVQENKTKVAKLTQMFSSEPSLDFGESWTEDRLDHIVCWLYTNSLRHLPVLVRQWWSTSDSRVSVAVDKITTQYVSPMLCQEELLNNKLQNIENMQVKVRPTLREVVALYQMDDTKLELNIVLPPNHPLGSVTVEPGQHAGGTANWRNCHMQLSIFLTHQNGSVWDGLALWKRNLDKKFAGVEECYICFSIFHINTYQIPKLSCYTCRKKFHTACLYKWFSTSQKSTCPICRNVF